MSGKKCNQPASCWSFLCYEHRRRFRKTPRAYGRKRLQAAAAIKMTRATRKIPRFHAKYRVLRGLCCSSLQLCFYLSLGRCWLREALFSQASCVCRDHGLYLFIARSGRGAAAALLDRLEVVPPGSSQRDDKRSKESEIASNCRGRPAARLHQSLWHHHTMAAHTMEGNF